MPSVTISKDEASLTKDIGQRCRRYRLAHKLSLDTLGYRIGMSGPTYSRIESGTRRLSVHELYLLSEVFGISVAKLLPRERP